ncbi:hypothetical protein ACFQX9_22455 [Bradyrhizobium sp. GCM10028915]|uniref:hypothetical protein n=1 Tax=Bradyrhizobium sp. GCM10028915 TaxID=3273385 RepID=UPI003616834B
MAKKATKTKKAVKAKKATKKGTAKEPKKAKKAAKRGVIDPFRGKRDGWPRPSPKLENLP